MPETGSGSLPPDQWIGFGIYFNVSINRINIGCTYPMVSRGYSTKFGKAFTEE
jgi:hypothetical protein